LLVVLGGAIAAVTVAVVESGSSPPPSLVKPMTVLQAAANLTGPVVEDGWFAWNRGPILFMLPELPRTAVYVRRGHGAAWRVNPLGSYAQTGGIADGKLVIQLLQRGRSELVLVDLRTRKPRVLPASINTPHAYQWRPSLSGDWLLWGRRPATNHYQIMLANLETGRVSRLDDLRGHAAYAEPGQINGRYATWLSCPDNVCRVYRYDVEAQTRIEMPPIGGGRYAQFGPSVTPDGTVYFGVDLYCANVRLTRWHKGRLSIIYRFRPGTSYDYSHAVGTKPASVYYDETGCSPTARSRIDLIRDTVP